MNYRETELKRINDWLISDMQQGISEVIDGKLAIWSCKHLSMSVVHKYLTTKGAKDLDKFDANGWQWDAWEQFEIDNKKWIVSTCGYSGGVSFERYTDEDEDDNDEPEENIEQIEPWE